MEKKDVRVFVSYARRNRHPASQFLKRFEEQASASKRFRYRFWQDRDILVGEDWQQAIEKALEECTLGLLLISPAFLGSRYVRKQELPRFVGNRAKPVVPMMLEPVDPKLHDLKGLKWKQIYQLERPTLSGPRPFAQCTAARRNEFAFELFRQVEGRLAKLTHGRRRRHR